MRRAVEDLNIVKNPRLNEGRSVPRGWRWRESGKGHTWVRQPGFNGHQPIMTVRSASAKGRAGWSRRLRCPRDEEHYRVETIVSGEYECSGAGTGFVLSIQPLSDGKPCGRRVELVGPAHMPGPTVLRAYYELPDDINWVELSVDLIRAKGEVRIHDVMMLPIIEPEAKSHVHAAVPHPYAYPSPRKIRSVCVCTNQGTTTDEPGGRPIVDLLRKYYGRGKVTSVAPSALRPDTVKADAVLLVDELPPPSIATLPKLYKLAETHLVVISLPAFARLVGSVSDIRTVIQSDDPIHAKHRFANHLTRGFALGDVFPYAWRGRDRRTFVQRHFRRSANLKAFCKRHEFETILESVCETEATSDRPICLHKETDGGGITVLDIEPSESIPTNFDEPDLALFLLLNVLGAQQNALGQYVTPARCEKTFRDEIVELRHRYPVLTLTGEDHPEKPRRNQLVQVGADEDASGLPVVPRPLILIRTGLQGDDTDGVYGAMYWLKNLVRPEPFACPYAYELISRFRFAWVPAVAAWHAGLGWRRPDDTDVYEHQWEFDSGSVAAVIDVTTTPLRELRVVVSGSTARKRCAELLPPLVRQFFDRKFLYRCAPKGQAVGEPAFMQWQLQKLVPQIVADEDGVFDRHVHRTALDAGATLIRLEVPGPTADLTCGSIWRTDLVAGMLEALVGLQYGWLAMNRRLSPMRIEPPAGGMATRGLILKMDGSEVVTKDQSLKAGRKVTLPPGTALCIRST